MYTVDVHTSFHFYVETLTKVMLSSSLNHIRSGVCMCAVERVTHEGLERVSAAQVLDCVSL